MSTYGDIMVSGSDTKTPVTIPFALVVGEFSNPLIFAPCTGLPFESVTLTVIFLSALNFSIILYNAASVSSPLCPNS